jgi:hypothetical protein
MAVAQTFNDDMNDGEAENNANLHWCDTDSCSIYTVVFWERLTNPCGRQTTQLSVSEWVIVRSVLFLLSSSYCSPTTPTSNHVK